MGVVVYAYYESFRLLLCMHKFFICAYTEVAQYGSYAHIQKRGTYREVVLIKKICAYTEVVQNFCICTTSIYVHILWICTNGYVHLRKLHIYINCSYMKIVHVWRLHIYTVVEVAHKLSIYGSSIYV